MYYVLLQNNCYVLLHYYAIIITWLLHGHYINITSLLHSLLLLHNYYPLLHWMILHIITKSLLRIITILLHYNILMITSWLHHYYKWEIMNPLFSVMQRVSLHYYVIITYYYVIITPGSLITRYNLFQTFQSPELADVTEQRFSLCLAAASRGCSWLGNSDCQEIR